MTAHDARFPMAVRWTMIVHQIGSRLRFFGPSTDGHLLVCTVALLHGFFRVGGDVQNDFILGFDLLEIGDTRDFRLEARGGCSRAREARRAIEDVGRHTFAIACVSFTAPADRVEHADILIVLAVAHRGERELRIDGRVRHCDPPVTRVVVYFDLSLIHI